MKNERTLIVIVDAVQDSRFLNPTLRSLDHALSKLSIKTQKILIDKESQEKRDNEAELDWHSLDRSWRVLKSPKDVHPLYTASKYLKSAVSSPFVFTILEAGSLVSANWLEDGLNLLEKNHFQTIIHPELALAVSRSGDRKVLKNASTRDSRFQSFHAIEKNLWSPLFLAPSEALKGFQIPERLKGWRQAYWHFYLDSLEQGFEHLVTPKTMHFWNQESLSFAEFADSHHERIPYPSAFLKRKFSAPQLLPVEHAAKNSTKPSPVSLSDWTKKAIQEAERYVPEWIKPKSLDEKCRPLQFAKPSAAFLFESLRDQLSTDLDCVLILHQLRRGGAELEALYHIEAIRKAKPGAKIVVLLTFVSDPDWSELLPRDVVIIEYGKLFSRYIDHFKEIDILYQVLTLLRPKMIHVKASEIGWNLFTKYGARLSQFSRLFCSLYCIDYTRDHAPTSFAYSHLPWTYNYLTKIFSDNQALKNHLHQTYGYQKIEVLKFPSRVKALEPKVNFKKGGNLKILWASRLSRQKNIPWLYMIAKSMPRDEFHVYGEYSERLPLIKQLFELKNVVYHGGFDGLDSVPTEQYDLFLYTSSWDGFPNILLEAGLKGLPIISTKVGGITELLNDENSYLADDCEQMKKLIAKLREEPMRAQEKARRLQKDIRHVHTEAKFFATLEKEFQGIFSEGRR